jgi:nicotinamidase-related amidase
MKVLIVIDMQHDFVDGILGTPEARAIVPAVAEKVKEYIKNDGVVIYT